MVATGDGVRIDKRIPLDEFTVLQRQNFARVVYAIGEKVGLNVTESKLIANYNEKVAALKAAPAEL